MKEVDPMAHCESRSLLIAKKSALLSGGNIMLHCYYFFYALYILAQSDYVYFVNWVTTTGNLLAADFVAVDDDRVNE